MTDVTSSSGSSLLWNEYYPHGVARLAGVGAGAPTNPFNFTGEQLDGLTGLYHLRARQYDPGTGRFLSIDPAAAAIAVPYVASYAYVRNNPCVFVDPSGLARDKTELAPDAEIDLSGLRDWWEEVGPCDPGLYWGGLALESIGVLTVFAAGLTFMGTVGVAAPVAGLEFTIGLLEVMTGASMIRRSWDCS